jgi:hypothetical protein
LRTVGTVREIVPVKVPERGEDSFALPASGRLEGLSIPELLWELGRRRHDGALVVESNALRKVVYFRQGRIVFAASSDPEDRLGHFLLKRGGVRLEPLLDASAQVVHGRRLGEVLIDRGAMDPASVVRAVVEQVREIVLSIFPWREGSWRITAVRLPADESITLDIALEDLILAGVRRVRDWRRIQMRVGGPRAVYRITPGAEIDRPGFGMTERAILDQLEHPTRVDTLCQQVFAPSYAVYRSMWALAILELVERMDPHPVQQTLAGPGEGSIRDDALSELLLDLGERSFTGVLRLFRGNTEGALFWKNGRVEFATTNDPDQSLSSHLLRRGVISEHDHEQAVRRLITGKRLGAILSESGVLAPEEVERFVREQILEVARDLLLWADGEYCVEEGLPSDEEITLSLQVEDLLMSAYESTDAFLRIWKAIGSLSSVYRLRPDYLERLDRMSLRPMVWELVSHLGEERTVEELIERCRLHDFELCRLLYALTRLRVVERVSTEELLDRARGAEPREEAAWTPDAVAERSPAEPALATTPASASTLAPELFGEDGARDEDLPAWLREPVPAVQEDEEADEAPAALREEELLAAARVAPTPAEESAAAAPTDEPDPLEFGMGSDRFDEPAPAAGPADEAAGPLHLGEVETAVGPEENEPALDLDEPTGYELGSFETDAPTAEPQGTDAVADLDEPTGYVLATDEPAETEAPPPLAEEPGLGAVAEAEAAAWELGEPGTGPVDTVFEHLAPGPAERTEPDGDEMAAFAEPIEETPAPPPEAVDEAADELEWLDEPEFDEAPQAPSAAADEAPLAEPVEEPADELEWLDEPEPAVAPQAAAAADETRLAEPVEEPLAEPETLDEPEPVEEPQAAAAADETRLAEPVEEPIAEPQTLDEPEPVEAPQAAAAADETRLAEPVEEPIAEPETLDEPEPVEEPAAVDEPLGSPEQLDPSATIEVPREAVLATLGVEEPPAAAPAAQTPEPVEEPDVLGLDAKLDPLVQEAIERFNRRHGALFRELRRDVGAGVGNFVRTCQRSLGEATQLFSGLEPDRDGHFDRDAIAERVLAGEWTSPVQELLEALIAEELAMLRSLLDPPRVATIEQALAQA